MDIRDREGLKRCAAERLSAASYDPKKLTVIHGAVAVGLSLMLSLLSLFLSSQIENTGGLSGIGLRNILETFQALLSYAYSLLLPFWQIGILFSFICIIRRQNAGPESLTRGFHRFGPVLRLKLLEFALYFVLAMICAYLSSFLAMTVSPKLYALLEPVAMAMTEDPYVDMEALIAQIPEKELLIAMIPMLVIFLGLYLAAIILIGYRLRFAQYLVVDDPKLGAFTAMRASLQLTRRRCMDLFRLDLSFWWYYALQLLAAVICYCDLLLPVIGIQLPIPDEWAAIVFYCVYAVILLAIDFYMRPQVEATYALAYDTIRTPPPAVSNNTPQV